MIQLATLAEKFSADELNKMLSIFIEAGQLLKDSPIRTLPIEMGIIEAAELVNISDLQSRRDNLVIKTEEVEKPKETILEKKPEPEPIVEEKISESVIPDLVGPFEALRSPQALEEDPPIVDSAGVYPVGLPQGDPVGGNDSQLLDETAWKNILEKIKENNQTLNALLRDAKPEGISDNEVIIGVRFKFHHDKITEIKNREILEKIISEVLGRKCTIKCQIRDKKKTETQKPKSTTDQSEDLEKATKEMFETE